MTYKATKTEAVENFIIKVAPFCTANNSANNIAIYLKHEVEKFYISAFADGQENVLKETESNPLQNVTLSNCEILAEGIYNSTFHCVFLGNCEEVDIKDALKKYVGKTIKIIVEEK